MRNNFYKFNPCWLSLFFLIIFFHSLLCSEKKSVKIVEKDYYSMVASEGSFNSLVTNVLWVNHGITCFGSSSDAPENIEEVKPLIIPKQLIISGELLQPYSQTDLVDIESYLSFYPEKILFSHKQLSDYAGIFFNNSHNGLIFSSSQTSLRSRGDIYLQPGINQTKPLLLGAAKTKDENWKFISNNSSSGTVDILAHELILPKLSFKGQYGSSSIEWGIDQLKIKTATGKTKLESGLIIENTHDKLLFSLRNDLDSSTDVLDQYAFLHGNIKLAYGVVMCWEAVEENISKIPSGIIIAFFSQNEPDNKSWLPCNGMKDSKSGPTPTLSDKFIMGSGDLTRHSSSPDGLVYGGSKGHGGHDFLFSLKQPCDYSHAHQASTGSIIVSNYWGSPRMPFVEESQGGGLNRVLSFSGRSDPPLLSESMSDNPSPLSRGPLRGVHYEEGTDDVNVFLEKALRVRAHYDRTYLKGIFPYRKDHLQRYSTWKSISALHRHALVSDDHCQFTSKKNVLSKISRIIKVKDSRGRKSSFTPDYDDAVSMDIQYNIPRAQCQFHFQNQTASLKNNDLDEKYFPKYAKIAFYIKK